MTSIVEDLLRRRLPELTRQLRDRAELLESMPELPIGGPETTELPPVAAAIIRGEQKYAAVQCPVLAIFAIPHASESDPVSNTLFALEDAMWNAAQVNAFQKAMPMHVSSGLRTLLTSCSGQTKRTCCVPWTPLLGSFHRDAHCAAIYDNGSALPVGPRKSRWLSTPRPQDRLRAKKRGCTVGPP